MRKRSTGFASRAQRASGRSRSSLLRFYGSAQALDALPERAAVGRRQPIALHTCRSRARVGARAGAMLLGWLSLPIPCRRRHRRCAAAGDSTRRCAPPYAPSSPSSARATSSNGRAFADDSTGSRRGGFRRRLGPRPRHRRRRARLPQHRHDRVLAGGSCLLSPTSPALRRDCRARRNRRRIAAGDQRPRGISAAQSNHIGSPKASWSKPRAPGSPITARMALDRAARCSPCGSPLDPRCHGSNNLIRQGAALTENVDDVIRGLGHAAARRLITASLRYISRRSIRLYAYLRRS